MNDQNIHVVEAKLPEELVLGVHEVSGCNGDGCNADGGGCSSDAGCGQDC